MVKKLVLLLSTIIVVGVAILYFLLSGNGIDPLEVVANDTITLNQTITTPTETCNASWQCLDENTKAYQLENCSYTQESACSAGCENGSCIIETCAPGWKCKGEYYRAYQSDTCAWVNKVKCDFGCLNATCQNETVTETTTEEAPAAPTSNLLKMGEIFNVTSGGNYYTLAIYNIGAEGVQLSINGKSSPWISDNTNYTSGSLTILVKDVYFQPYSGGKQEITYLIN
ncbi:MAG: hypothetical protein KKH52_02950 [Nanoarchaeota archaeon]|nr:hypothetical protein [Nanoarchaeota archaeon]MBU1622869.1 hypothetical protein [Nanoarchaeota archaeon]MBU1974328.1 hypothetical protein [Nanoarchaeota archaeon]